MHEIHMMNKMKSAMLNIMNPKVTELKPPIENQEFVIFDSFQMLLFKDGLFMYVGKYECMLVNVWQEIN